VRGLIESSSPVGDFVRRMPLMLMSPVSNRRAMIANSDPR
jgi:hypothetical protein